VDHKNIDVDVEFMKGRLSSTENLAIAIWEQLSGPISGIGCALHRIRLKETENNEVEYYG
jgi:6-pyruvoyltetrahydropterin/6-carboxytetrahydropterin synthase